MDQLSACVNSTRHLGGIQTPSCLADPMIELVDSRWSQKHTLQFDQELNNEDGLRPATVRQLLQYVTWLKGFLSLVMQMLPRVCHHYNHCSSLPEKGSCASYSVAVSDLRQVMFFANSAHALDRMVASTCAAVHPLRGLLGRCYHHASLCDLRFLETDGFIAGVVNPMFKVCLSQMVFLW